MPLGQRLGKPSRSYLQGLNEAGDGAETGSILSFRSGGSSFSQQQGRRAAGQHNGGGSQAGSVRGRFDSLPPSVMNGSAVPRARGSAASDIGMTFTPASPSRRDTIASSKARNSGNRRSVQFSDMAPAVFDEREKLEVMSDVGGYRGMGFGFRKRTPSVISSVMDDNASDAGSTMSHRRSVKRGSRSDKVVLPPSLNLWQKDLGGPGLVKRSPTGGTVVSTSDPSTSIVRRKSTLGSPKKLLGNEQPSRRYATGPAAVSSSASASGALPSSVPQQDESKLVLPSTNLARSNSANSSHSSSPANSEASFGMRTTLHSRHSQKQRAKSGLDAKIPPVPPMPETAARPDGLQRSLSTGSTGSRQSSGSKATNSNRGSASELLHSTTLSNNLANGSALHASPTKRKVRHSVCDLD